MTNLINLIAAVGTIVAAIGTLAAVFVSYVLLRRNTDPDVIVYTEQDLTEPRFLYIVIENVGNGPANNIDFQLSHELSHEIVFFPRKLTGAFTSGIPTLPSRGKRKYIWGDFRSVIEHLEGGRVVCDITFYGRLYFTPVRMKFKNTCVIEADSYRDSVDQRIDEDRALTKEIRKLRETVLLFGPVLKSFNDIARALGRIGK